MASQNFLGASITGGTREKTYFEQQREALVGEIANSFEHVLANINKLNRSSVTEFSSVEALWSQFENVMAKDPEEQTQQAQQAQQQQERGAAAQREEGQQSGQEQGQGEEDDTKMEVDEEDSKIKMER
ncbi:unnamed protein product [Sordaria macrospora k-hell]|uniref:DASH complex subunit DAD1 n=1 Tax=Sordaria macrospora (strain ATCC MYA-333 / DSM 997 / K(L3346) / K-hell) TaxID=771870 RepID=F7WA01_SORMK|nr:uncharacterized protein SMAC_08279 [Sordaria macrospora k-hell]CCC05268.1 unnamed protein product [Sordaria macrospora k-hell]